MHFFVGETGASPPLFQLTASIIFIKLDKAVLDYIKQKYVAQNRALTIFFNFLQKV